MANVLELRLVKECKIADLLPSNLIDFDKEASGVLQLDGKYFVVFDNQTAVARLSDDLTANPMNGLFGMAHIDDGYEGIAYNAAKHRYYLLIESRKQKSGRFRSEIFEYDETLSFVKSRPVDFDFESGNKGFEAVSHVRRDGQDYVLALCEGNKCKSGRKGRQPGGGRIQLFKKKKNHWAHIDTIKLPTTVLFEDYSAMAIDDHRVAVVSQQNSALWIGVFEESAWGWRDEGQSYQFPRAADGEISYGNVEGVDWITTNRLVTVSDRRKDDDPPQYADKDQSIHVFDLPSSTTAG